MISVDFLRSMVQALPETSEDKHFDKISFKVKKKIFLTFNAKEHRACVKLTAIDQQVFCLVHKEIVWPVPNAWGKQGWTLVNMIKINKESFTDLVHSAFCTVAPKRLAQIIQKQF